MNDFKRYFPSYKLIKSTVTLVDCLQEIGWGFGWWQDPLFNIGNDGEVVLEWWHKQNKLTIYVNDESIDYIKVWGADMDNEMEDGVITLDTDLRPLWKWLIT